jgi:hypothetical protein
MSPFYFGSLLTLRTTNGGSMTSTTTRILYDDAQRLMSRIKWAERALDDAKRFIGDKTPLTLTLPMLDDANKAVEEAREWLRGANDGSLSQTMNEADPPEERAEVEALERGISLAQTAEDLKRCAEILRGWNLPKGIPTSKRFARLLLERAKELGIELPTKTQEPLSREPGCDDMDGEERAFPPRPRVESEKRAQALWESYEKRNPPDLPKHELQDGLPRIVNAPLPPQKKLLDAVKSQREILKSMVSISKMGLDKEECHVIDALSEELFRVESQDALKELFVKVEGRPWSEDALSRLKTLFRTRHEHISELKQGGAK